MIKTQFFDENQQKKPLTSVDILKVALFTLNSPHQSVMQTCSKPQGYEENLQPFTKYLRQTLDFMCNSALREKSNFYFSEDFFQY